MNRARLGQEAFPAREDYLVPERKPCSGTISDFGLRIADWLKQLHLIIAQCSMLVSWILGFSFRRYLGFIEFLMDASEMFNMRVAAYCLMANHYHLLIQTHDANLSRCMRHINGVYTQRYNARNGCDGTLFRGRYKAILVDGDSYLLELVRYIPRCCKKYWRYSEENLLLQRKTVDWSWCTNSHFAKSSVGINCQLSALYDSAFRKSRWIPMQHRGIHRNPLRAGITDKLKDYSWSSHKGYIVPERKPCSDTILDFRF